MSTHVHVYKNQGKCIHPCKYMHGRTSSHAAFSIHVPRFNLGRGSDFISRVTALMANYVLKL